MVIAFFAMTAVYTAFLFAAIFLMSYRLGQLRDTFTQQAFQAGFNTARRTRSWSVKVVDGKPALSLWSDDEGDLKTALNALRRQMSPPSVAKPTFTEESPPYERRHKG